MEKFNSTKLIGAPPGYVGHEDGGQLTEKVRRKPYSIVLFDEIEKAHPDIFNSLLQILDEGSITDGLGRKINFKNTLIILTSNVGQRKLNEFGPGIGFSANKSEKAKIEGEILLKKELQKTFSPEFLNRLDEIIYFDQLTKENILNILEVELERMRPRFDAIGVKIKITDSLKNKIAEVGYDPKFGARPLKRVLQKYVEDSVAETMISNSLGQGDVITLDFDSKKENTTSTPVKIKIARKNKKPIE
jgi:ATP-dependent Clp protease ATP-binding subunit ClpC